MNTEKHAAEILLDRGVSWPVPSPWPLRVIGKKKLKLTIKALKLGTLLEISYLYTVMNITADKLKEDPHAIISNHLKTVCLAAAMAVLNSRAGIWLFSKPLARYIRWHFTGNMLLEVMIFIATYSGVTSFLSTIGLLGDLSVTAPRDPSPEIQGSQQK
jgi:hypothetical protein